MGNLRALCACDRNLYAHFAARATYGWGAEIRKAEYEKMQQYAFSTSTTLRYHP